MPPRRSRRRRSIGRDSREYFENVGLISKADTAVLLERLGFKLDQLTVEETFDEVDGDGDGFISEDEFITCLGMLKRNLLEVHHLEISFKRFRDSAKGTQKDSLGDSDEHIVYASDLVATLGVTEQEAEEMIFIADLKDNQQIDFTEFKQVVVNWSG